METTTIEQEVIIPAEPERVYTGFLDPKTHSAMTGGEATGEGRVGAEFTAWDGYIYGTYLKLEPHHTIVAEWRSTEWPDDAKPSRLELHFAPTEGGTRLTMKHSNVPTGQAESYAQGWHTHYWEPMAAYFRTHE